MQIQSWFITGQSFHFGLHGMGQEETSLSMLSDSLFAALVARLARSAGAAAAERFCQPFVEGKPPFTLSSTFPRAGSVLFFPPPISSRRPPTDSTKFKDPKAFKRVDYVSEELFRSLLAGKALSELSNLRFLQGEKLWLSEAEFKRLPARLQEKDAQVWEQSQRPRVTLDRASQASTLFFTGQVTFAPDCGLWFGIQWLDADETLRHKVAGLLSDLALAGLGAERNSGLGGAEIKPAGNLDLPDPIGAWMTLGRYLPAATEISLLEHEGSSYALKTVGGWLDSPVATGQRRKAINLLDEGSVFGAWPGRTPGRMEDVRPSYQTDPDPLGHPVYRNGFALAVGLKGGEA